MYQNQKNLQKSKSSTLLSSPFDETLETETQIYRTDPAKNLLTHQHSFYVQPSSRSNAYEMNLSEIIPKEGSQDPTQNTKNKGQIALQVQSIKRMQDQISKALVMLQELDKGQLRLILKRLNEGMTNTGNFLIQSIAKNNHKILEASMDSDQNRRKLSQIQIEQSQSQLQIEQNSSKTPKSSVLSEYDSQSNQGFLANQPLFQGQQSITAKQDTGTQTQFNSGTKICYKDMGINVSFKFQKQLKKQIQTLKKKIERENEINEQLNNQNIILADSYKLLKQDFSRLVPRFTNEQSLKQSQINDINPSRLISQKLSDKHLNIIEEHRQEREIKSNPKNEEAILLAPQPQNQQASSSSGSALRPPSHYISEPQNIQASDSNRYQSTHWSHSMNNLTRNEHQIIRTVSIQQNVESSGQSQFSKFHARIQQQYQQQIVAKTQ